jgi:hypothetical protein
MPNKKQISDALNDYLDTEIDWSQLRKADLEKLVELLDDPVELVRKMARAEVDGKIKDKSRDIVDRVEEAIKQIPRPLGIIDWLLEKREK